MNQNNCHVSSYTHTILVSQAVVRGWRSTSGLVESEPTGDFTDLNLPQKHRKYGKTMKITILELWELTKDTEQTTKHRFKRNY